MGVPGLEANGSSTGEVTLPPWASSSQGSRSTAWISCTSASDGFDWARPCRYGSVELSEDERRVGLRLSNENKRLGSFLLSLEVIMPLFSLSRKAVVYAVVLPSYNRGDDIVEEQGTNIANVTVIESKSCAMSVVGRLERDSDQSPRVSA